MKKYRIVKYNRPSSSVYTIQKRVLFWWLNTDIDCDIVIPFFYHQYYVLEYETLERARKSLDDILNNQKKIIIDEV